MVEYEIDADEVIDDLERRIKQAALHREHTPYDELDVEASAHLETIQRQGSGQ